MFLKAYLVRNETSIIEVKTFLSYEFVPSAISDSEDKTFNPVSPET